ncbi:MAG TPA: GAF domain-containing protein, partial [Polyangia bacterium]|nr:GAF domain-containing protein [Polyangia bacterium]
MPDSQRDLGDPAVADLESVISTSELSRRPTRPPDHEAENRALVGLVEAMTASPDDILQNLVETALKLCRAHSAGISVPDGERECFRWPAIAGQWASYVGDGTRRDFGPCSTVLSRNTPILFSRPERYFAYLMPIRPPVEEALLIPFHVGGKAIGTIWVLAHDRSRRFDSEDLRVMTNLAHFAAAAYSARTLQVAARADVSAALATQESLRGMLQSCAEALVRHLDAALARIWVITKDRSTLELKASAGIDRRLDGANGNIPVGRSLIGVIAREGKPCVTDEMMKAPGLDDPECPPAEGMAAFAGYPLLAGGQAVGVLAMFSRKPMSHGTTETLATLSDAIAQGIQRAQGQADLRRSEAFLTEAQRLSRTGSFAWRMKPDEVTWSDEAYRIYEFDRGSPITIDRIRSRVHAEDIEVFDATVDRARRAGSDFELQHRLLMPDQSIKHVQVIAHGSGDRDGRVEFLG